jgi:hypothetical protein
MQTNPEECTSPEAWAELVRTERLSAQQMAQELARARGENAGLRGENQRLAALLAGQSTLEPEA